MNNEFNAIVFAYKVNELFTSTLDGLAVDGKQAGATFERLGRSNPFFSCRRE